MITSIIKRDGSIEPFNPEKIVIAISKAGSATGEFDTQVSKELVQSMVLPRINAKKGRAVSVEDVQDIVENVLFDTAFEKTYKAYAIYRNEHTKARERQKVAVDVESSVNEYINQDDWRVRANANQGYSLGGMILNVSGKVTANYWLNSVYPKEVGLAHRNGDFHIHDLDMLAGYCCGHSLRALLNEGFNGVANKVASNPPKHFSSALSQAVNFLGTLQNEFAGAQAFSSFDTYLAPYVRVDKLTYPEVRQNIQEFVFNLNVPSRWGCQTPFTNLTFDIHCPDDLKNQHPLIGGKEVDFTYGDLQEEMDMINRAYIEVMIEGDAQGRIFTFPIPTYNITDDFDWDSENSKLMFEMTAKYGTPYFQNFMNSDLDPHMIRSMCCRLRLDLTELIHRGNGLFGSAEQTGSIGVVTINLARLGYLFKGNWEGLLERFDYLCDLAKESLELKRKLITKLMDEGLYPFTKRYLGSFKNFFSTIGVNGANEMIRNFSDDQYDITDERGHKLAVELLEHLNKRIQNYQAETGNLYNSEATPAEGTATRFAREDRKRFPDIIQAGQDGHRYYTNSTQLPAGFTDDPFEALDHQTDLQRLYLGGTALHLFTGERISSWKAARDIVRKTFSHYQLPYITITPTFSICPKHGYIAGEHKFCPLCDDELVAKKKHEKEKCQKAGTGK